MTHITQEEAFSEWYGKGEGLGVHSITAIKAAFDVGFDAARLAEGEQEPWKPIETAPKDGTAALLYGYWAGEINGINPAKTIDIGYWSGGKGDYFDGFAWTLSTGDAYGCWMVPSHWMPLPAAPQGAPK